MARGRKVVQFTEATVDIPIDEVEVGIKSRELANLCNEIDKEEADARAAAGSARKNIRMLKERRRVLADCVCTRSKKEPAQLNLGNRAKS